MHCYCKPISYPELFKLFFQKLYFLGEGFAHFLSAFIKFSFEFLLSLQFAVVQHGFGGVVLDLDLGVQV